MARADLLIELVKQGIKCDKNRFRKVADAIIAEERAKKHLILAERLEKIVSETNNEKPATNGSVVFNQRTSNFLYEITPERRLEELVLPNHVKEVTLEIVQEQHRADLLRSYNLEPRNKILLIGPPGNGKTSLAEAIASEIMIPFFVVRYDAVIGTYLGETAQRLKRLIEHVSTRHCVLFFDEFETLGKERGDRHETGEIKRVVSSLLMQVDSLPSHVVVIGATNHPELLDRAVWRRFQIRVNLPKPTRARLEKWFEKFEKKIEIQLGYSSSTLAKKLYGISFAEAEEFGISVYRKYVLNRPNSDMKTVLSEALKNWKNITERTEQQNGGE